MKKKLLVLILMFGIPAIVLSQIFANTPQATLATLEWGVYAYDRDADITYSEGEGYTWMNIFSHGVAYRVYLTLRRTVHS